MAKEMQQLLTQVVGVVLTLVGLVGFLTGETLLVFGINPLHNIVHLVTGALGLVAGFCASATYPVQYNRWLGIIYLIVAVLGFVAPTLMASLLHVNAADNILHLALGAVLAGVGFGAKS